MTETARSGAEPIEIIEIDQPLCTRAYGVSPCTASLDTGGRKCFNTLASCQDVASFDQGVLTLRFCSSRVTVPQDGNYYFPYLDSVRVEPGIINPGGGNKSISPLGVRAKITVSMTDAPHTDRIVDPYQSERITGAAQSDGIGYNPYEFGTFWTKWLTRNRYYINREIRYISGYIVDGQIVDSVTRTFLISSIVGPTSNDKVNISGLDILSRVQAEKALAPRFSRGRLSADIDDTETTIVLEPAGVGNAEYPASGFVKVSGEVMSFTRSGNTLTVVRGRQNTTRESHSEGDRVQLCLEFASKRPDQIIETLLMDYANIPGELLNNAGWQAEVTDYIGQLYSALICEPTSVQKLLGEICEQMGLYIWFDERDGLVNLRAVRPAEGETIYELDDSRHLVEDSVSVSDLTDQIVTRVAVNFAQINPARDLEEPSNYAATEVILSPEELPERLGESRTKVIYSRWIQEGSSAIVLGQKLLARFSTPPKKVSFQLTAKDREVWVGSFAQIKNRRSVDDIGRVRPVNIQVLSANESRPGSLYSYMGQEFVFEQPVDPLAIPLRVSASVNNLNLRTFYETFRGAPPSTGEITIIIRSGVRIGATGVNAYAINVGSWPVGIVLNLIIESGALAAGRGGRGGNSGSISGVSVFDSENGQDGGSCLLAARPINITNLGVLAGGGGGGGGGQSAVIFERNVQIRMTGGGAGNGGGLEFRSAAGIAGTISSSGSNDFIGRNGGLAGEIARGNGGNGGSGAVTASFAGRGGSGGAAGQPGQIGALLDFNPPIVSGVASGFVASLGARGLGGSPGFAVVGESFVNWVNKGAVLGPTQS